MKQLILIATLVTCSLSAFAQFPLGAKMQEIKTYFAENVSYAAAQEFKTNDGVKAICFTKVKVVGDYTFYFDYSGLCTSYIVTYDRNELTALQTRFDNQFCRMQKTRWIAEDSAFEVNLVLPKGGENYFSIVYKSLHSYTFPSTSFASN